MSAVGSRRMALALVGVTALALALRVAGIGQQPLLADDVMVGDTARNFVEHGWPLPTMWNHPRLRDLLVYVSMASLGPGAWGLKVWSVLLGTLSVAAVGYLVWIVTSSVAAAGVTALVVATDPLHVDFSRQAINDVYLALFPVAAAIALLRYAERRRPWYLVFAGLLLALGLSSKWGAAFPVAAAAALTLPGVIRSAGSARARRAELAFVLAGLALLPLAIYVLTYWPWFGRGNGLAELVRFHRAMAYETSTHTGYAGTKLPGFPGEVVGAWRWFLQPSWYVDYLRPMPGRADIPAAGLFVSAVANPLTWMATLPAAAWAAWRWVRVRDRAAGTLLVLFLASYLPFIVVPRPIWTNSAMGVVPFSAALVGWAAARVRQRSAPMFWGWLSAAMAVALLLWPPATGTSWRPSNALVRAMVSPLALDPDTHLGPDVARSTAP